MGNFEDPRILAAADHVTRTNDDDGVAVVLERMLARAASVSEFRQQLLLGASSDSVTNAAVATATAKPIVTTEAAAVPRHGTAYTEVSPTDYGRLVLALLLAAVVPFAVVMLLH